MSNFAWRRLGTEVAMTQFELECKYIYIYIILEWFEPIISWWSVKNVKFCMEEAWDGSGNDPIWIGVQIWMEYELDVGFSPL